MPTVVGAEHVTGTSASLSCPVPAGTVNGDLLIAGVTANESQYQSVNTPAGWTRVSVDQETADLRGYIFYRFANAEPANYSFGGTNSVGLRWGLFIASMHGIDTAIGLLDSATATYGTAATHTGPTVTVTSEGNVVFTMIANYSNTANVTFSTTNAGTEAVEWSSGSYGGALYFRDNVPVGSRAFSVTQTGTPSSAVMFSAVFASGSNSGTMAGVFEALAGSAEGRVVNFTELDATAPVPVFTSAGQKVPNYLRGEAPLPAFTSDVDVIDRGPMAATFPLPVSDLGGRYATISVTAPAPSFAAYAETKVTGARVVTVINENRILKIT